MVDGPLNDCCAFIAVQCVPDVRNLFPYQISIAALASKTHTIWLRPIHHSETVNMELKFGTASFVMNDSQNRPAQTSFSIVNACAAEYSIIAAHITNC